MSARTEPVRTSRVIAASPVFYGWVIAAVGTLGTILSSPGQTYTISIFIERFIEDLGISRTVVSSLYTVGTLAGSLALPAVGRMVDKRGSRIMAAAVSVLFGLACIYTSTVRNAIMLGIAFVLLRMLGQGSLGLVMRTTTNQWWVRRRGTIIGIVGLTGSVLGMGLFPSLVNWLIPTFGWRVAYVQLGVLLLVVMLPAALLFVRNRPEEYGLVPDGMARGADDAANSASEAEEDWTLQEAMRTPALWVVAVGLASVAMLSTGLHFHMVSVFEDSGLSTTAAATVFMPIAVTAALANLGSGILVDRVPVRIILVAMLVLQALALVMVQFLRGTTMAFAYGVILGLTNGLQMTASSVVWPMYFGRRHLGAIGGVTSMVMIAGSSLGPLPMGIAHDLFGNYITTLNVLAVLPLLCAVANMVVGKPRKQAGSGV